MCKYIQISMICEMFINLIRKNKKQLGGIHVFKNNASHVGSKGLFSNKVLWVSKVAFVE